ncbi:hypothetical protein DUGA6_36070 [Duganella sp. HH105]|nr:hypothetical protein DUGA6_36070 [Duganella sp. HH105]
MLLAAEPAAAGAGAVQASGRVNVKQLPLPGSLTRPMPPPSSCARSREIDRPRPVPPYLRLVVPSACWKALKMACWSSARMPMPVSCTAKAMRPSPSARAASVIWPPLVNLSAFDSRFLRICSRRWRSLVMWAARPSAICTWKASFFCCASGSNSMAMPSITWRGDSCSGTSSSLPASTLEMSRMSLIRLSKSLPAE